MKYLFFILISFQLQAAPIPGTSSSVFIQNHKQLFESSFGFSIHSTNTDWYLTKPPTQNPYVITLFKAPKENPSQASLSVRVDHLSQPTKLKKYMSRWKSDYIKFGFQLLNFKKVKVVDKYGYLVDLINQKSKKQLRQVIFLKDKQAVILTCRDQKKFFRKSLKTCNQIIRNFAWN